MEFFQGHGMNLMLVPNAASEIAVYLENRELKGLILSGGNDLSGEIVGDKGDDNIKDASVLRDEQEKKLLGIAIEKKLPVLGICRGMQFINNYFGGKVRRTIGDEGSKEGSDHVAVWHNVDISGSLWSDLLGKTNIETKSYHRHGVKTCDLSPHLKVIGLSGDGLVEAIYHPQLPIVGIQWHPERETPRTEDSARIIESFKNKTLYWSLR